MSDNEENPSNMEDNTSEAELENSKAVGQEQALEECRKKAAENWDLFLRARADLDNARRRAMMDLENAHKYGVEKFAKELLSVVDSLDHGLVAASQGEGITSLKEGMELTYKLLLDTLEKFGIKQINPVGQAFNPTQHEALSAQPNNEVDPNQVLIVVQKGFTLNDRLLRPARVIVSKRSET